MSRCLCGVFTWNSGRPVLRFSDKWEHLRAAFLAIREKRDATPLAKLAPTSVLFGVWDSRDKQVKQPRIVGSTIRAFGGRQTPTHFTGDSRKSAEFPQNRNYDSTAEAVNRRKENA